MSVELIDFNELIERTRQDISDCQIELSKMPKGFLSMPKKKSAGKSKPVYLHCFYDGCKIKQVTIHEGDSLVYELARKKYLKKKLSVLKDNLELLSRIGDDYINPSFGNIVTSLTQVYSSLPAEYFNNKYTLEALEWMNEPFDRDMTYAKYNVIPTSLGFKVKSKGERDIIERMVNYAVPLHHEEIIYIDYHKIAPDITFKRPSNGELGYWEHFGRMFDPTYRKNFIWKLQQLEKIGIFPGKNLIVTFEGEGQFLSIAEIDEIIKSKIL